MKRSSWNFSISRGSTPLRLLLLAALFTVVARAGYSMYQLSRSHDGLAITQINSVHGIGLIDPVPKGLAPSFLDQRHQLVADTPSDPSLLRDPQTLIVAHVIQGEKDGAAPEIPWAKFETRLSELTGRKVSDVVYVSSPEQFDRIKAGTISVVALHSPDVPFLVNHFGFEPIAVLGNGDGANGNRLDIIVPSASKIQTLPELKDHTLTCTIPSSIVGYRAAIALLMQTYGMRPEVDYQIAWSGKQEDSIAGIAEGTYEIAAVSHDKLKAMLDDGSISPKSYRVLYESAVIPRTTIGCFYDLQPDLAAKVREAIITADLDTGRKDSSIKFIPINYKKDFQLVRDIDDHFDPRLDSKAKQPNPAVPSTLTKQP